ncbi:unnamed protein product, partial [Medioppia subpectinata]
MTAKSGQRSGRWTQIGHFIRLLSVEPFLFAVMFVGSMKKVPTDQLAQDKICRLSYGLNNTYCAGLSTMTANEDYLRVKSKVLADATNFALYNACITTFPSILTALFIGSWTDSYIRAPQYVLLMNQVPVLFAGGMSAIITSIWGYIASTTPFHMRALRMTIAEIINISAMPLGTYVGGIVLNTQTMFTGDQIHNYSGVFIICCLSAVLLLLWVIYRVDEERDMREWERHFGETTNTITREVDEERDMREWERHFGETTGAAVDGTDTNNSSEARIADKLQKYEDNKHIHPMKLLFNLNNVKEMLSTCCLPRANHVRLQIWLMFVSMVCYMMSYVGPQVFMFQFTEKVYSWDSRRYSNAATLATIAQAVGPMIVGPLLVKVFKIRDTTLAAVGFGSYLSMNVIRGVVLNPSGFYYSLIPGNMGAVGSIGIRSHYSKIVKAHELGKVFSLLAAIEAVSPLVASFIFSSLFNATMDTMPGLSLLVVALVLVYPIVVVTWIHFFTVLPDSYIVECSDAIEPSGQPMSRLSRLWQFSRLLTIEPYIFVLMFIYTLKKVPTDQLAQDKICRLSYGMNTTYCQQLSHMTADEDYMHVKSKILADSTNFGLYMIIISTLPTVLTSLFIGAWTDNYINAKKVLLIMGSMAMICEAVINILNDYFFDLSQYVVLMSALPLVAAGGILGTITATWGYVASTTPFHMRALRMTIAEIVNVSAMPLGTYVGGIVLNTPSMFSSGQIHNYSGVYLIMGIANALILLWVIYRVDEEKDLREWERVFGTTGADGADTSKESAERLERKLKRYEDNKHIHPIRLLFNMKNVKEMLITCCERRPNHVRLQIWLLFIGMACFLLSYVGPIIFLFQFTQKVYKWDSKIYSNGSAIGSIVQAVGSMIVGPLLVRVFKLRDTTLSLFGCGSFLALNLIRGLVLTPNGFYYALIPGFFGPVGSIGMRTHYSKIVRPHELGKVFSLLASIEAVSPLIASFLFTSIFNATMDSTPGLGLIIVGLVMLIPMVILTWIHFFTVLPDFENNTE